MDVIMRLGNSSFPHLFVALDMSVMLAWGSFCSLWGRLCLHLLDSHVTMLWLTLNDLPHRPRNGLPGSAPPNSLFFILLDSAPCPLHFSEKTGSSQNPHLRADPKHIISASGLCTEKRFPPSPSPEHRLPVLAPVTMFLSLGAEQQLTLANSIRHFPG